MAITPLPPAPNPDDPSTFDTLAYPFTAALQQLATEINQSIAGWDYNFSLTVPVIPRTFTEGERHQARANLGLGSASLKYTGTSGDAVPLLNVANTWSAVQNLAGNGGYVSGFSTSAVYTPAPGVAGYVAPSFRQTLNNGAYFDQRFRDVVGVRTEMSFYLFPFAGDTEKEWVFRSDGSAVAVTGAWVSSSDERLKPDFARIPDPVSALFELNGGTWTRIDTGTFGVGIKAQDAERAVPGSAIVVEAEKVMPDGTVINDALAIDTAGVGVAVLVEALKVAFTRIEELERKLEQV